MKTPKMPPIAFTNAKGEVRTFPAKMTLKELIAAGVTNIRIVKPNVPLKNGEWRNLP